MMTNLKSGVERKNQPSTLSLLICFQAQEVLAQVLRLQDGRSL
jgi:hypothetical protein